MRRSLAFFGLMLAGATSFVLWHFPLLTPAGRVAGLTSDSGVIALMGKKIFDGRGFDIFFWGQNYVGPFTSILIAAWGPILGGVVPLALRLGVFTEVFAGIVMIAWAVARIDRRAAIVTAIALLITPPVVLRMMETPLGAEMAFFFSAALLMVLVQHFTAPPGAGWLSRRRGQIAFGVLTGIAWWMNQQVVFTLIAAAIVFAMRSKIGAAILPRVRLRDRLLLRGASLGWRSIPGTIEALAWIMSASGWLILFAYVVLDIAGSRMPLLVFGPTTDALILILTPQILLPLLFGEWRAWGVRPPNAGVRREIAAALCFAGGFALGYAPVWLGRIAGWYERTYVFWFSANRSSQVVAHVRTLAREDGPFWLGIADHPIGVLFAIAACALVIVFALRARSEARMLLLLIPLANVIFYLLADSVKSHYLISSVGMLFAVAAIAATDLWDAWRWPARMVLVAIGIAAMLSIGMRAQQRHRDLLAEPDPLPLLARVRAADCAVVYCHGALTYRYRFLDGEQRAWIQYLSQNRMIRESIADQRLPGQRCLITADETVLKIDKDLPLKHRPPGR